MRPELSTVLWIGGGSGAGKTTVARALAQRWDLIHYSTDDAMADHGQRAAPDRTPLLQAFLAMDMDRRWVQRSPAEMLDTFHWFAGEGFDLIIDDLRALTADGSTVVADGFRLLPHLVAPWLADPGRAVWLLSTTDFRRRALARRGDTWAIAGRTSDPDRALANLLERDRLFTDRVAADARSLDLATITLDRFGDAEGLVDRVSAMFGFGRD